MGVVGVVGVESPPSSVAFDRDTTDVSLFRFPIIFASCCVLAVVGVHLHCSIFMPGLVTMAHRLFLPVDIAGAALGLGHAVVYDRVKKTVLDIVNQRPVGAVVS